jgi:thiol-disulfide isomerase/thioredoxin
MVPLGTKAPPFKLPDTVSGKMVSLDDVKSSLATVVMFICNHCPYVKHINAELVNVAKAYQAKGVSFVAICSNDITQQPGDSPEEMKATARRLGYPFPYLHDESQAVAKAYRAACTPDLFVYDKDLKLVYRGQFDDARPSKPVPVTGKDLRAALDALVAGQAIAAQQRPSAGCNIKWKGAA